MGSIGYFIIFILLLSVIVIVHEFGHLIVAKKCGVYCKEFSIGMGPVVWQKQGKETMYSIRLFPIGGFVAMAGEDSEADEKDELDIPFERTLNGIKRWKQILVMAAGAMMNIVLAFVVFVGINLYQGQVIVEGTPKIVEVVDGGAAQKAGFKVGDEIIKMSTANHSETIKNRSDFSMFLQFYPQETTYTIIRDGKEMELKAKSNFNEEEESYQLGVKVAGDEVKDINFLEAIPYGVKDCIDSVKSVLKSLGMLIQGVGLNQVSGPVGIFQVTAEVAQSGFISLLSLLALLSVNVGIMNLVPIPILDGGRILILLIEAIIGKKLSEKTSNIIMTIGLLMIVALMVLATWNDIVRIFF